MKGFPNQIADLAKLATGMACIVAIDASGESFLDDGVFGQSLVREGVAGTGHRPRPIDEYLRDQLRKPHSGQSFRTTARGLRELFRLLGFITGAGQITRAGYAAAAFSGRPMDAEQIEFWRAQVLAMTHTDESGYVSHPYQVLLRLVSRRPGIVRANCALALEANTDSPEELDRIVALADLDEESILHEINETRTNWDNAKKILPAFALQLGDIVRIPHSQGLRIAEVPGGGDGSLPTPPAQQARAFQPPARSSRQVLPETIGRSGTGDYPNKIPSPTFESDPLAAAATAQLRADRLRRHNLLVQRLAVRLHAAGAVLFEGVFDMLALSTGLGVLVEVKTLDGSAPDEVAQVRDCLSQLLYYEAFVTEPVAGDAGIRRVACFEHPVSPAHVEFLNANAIAVIWPHNQLFAGDLALSASYLGHLLGELQ